MLMIPVGFNYLKSGRELKLTHDNSDCSCGAVYDHEPTRSEQQEFINDGIRKIREDMKVADVATRVGRRALYDLVMGNTHYGKYKPPKGHEHDPGAYMSPWVHPSIVNWAEGHRVSPQLKARNHVTMFLDEIDDCPPGYSAVLNYRGVMWKRPLFPRATEPCWSKWGARCGKHCTPQPVPCSYIPYKKIVDSVRGTIMGMLDDREIVIGKVVE